MNREIKFRAWAEDKKIMLNNYADNTTLLTGGIDVASYHRNSEANYAQKLILMQHTGLCDMKSKWIYEGDILAPFGNISHDLMMEDAFVVKWEVNGWNIGAEPDCDYAIVGNIYENPELLKEPK